MDVTNEIKSKKRPLEQLPILIRLPYEGPIDGSPSFIMIDKENFKIGRLLENDVCIKSVYISRNHCMINYDQTVRNWIFTNSSSTDTLINGVNLAKGESRTLQEGDIIQLSLSTSFKYRFTLDPSVVNKFPRLDQHEFISNYSGLNDILSKQKIFAEFHANERKGLEEQLSIKAQEQENLQRELEKLLDEQNTTKTCNEELNNQILELKSKINTGNEKELELQEKYKELVKKLDEEKLKFDEQLNLEKAKFEEQMNLEKQKWEEVLKETKEQKDQLEMSMLEQMEEWRSRQQKQWDEKFENLLKEKKEIQDTVQNKLVEEKNLLLERLQQMEKQLKEREAREQQLQGSNISKKRCIVVPRKGKNKASTSVNQQEVSETIDLTGPDHGDAPTQPQVNVIDKVNDIMDEQLTCSICSELFIRAMTLNCTHTFCRYCIEIWIKKSRSCPECRAHIVALTRSLVVDNFIEKILQTLTPDQLARRKEIEKQRIKAIPLKGARKNPKAPNGQPSNI